MPNTVFSSFIGIDYSGAQFASTPLRGIQIFKAHSPNSLSQINPTRRDRKYWCREDLAHWIAHQVASSEQPILIGIDHALSFPLSYFEKYSLRKNWDAFLDDFQHYWPTHHSEKSVKDLLEFNKNSPEGRFGDARWRRLTDTASKGAKSVFHFGVPGAVASSTHAGLTWIRFLRHHPKCVEKIHFWPFDGWYPAEGKSVIAEVYPALWNKFESLGTRTQDEHDAWSVAKELSKAFGSETGLRWFDPEQWTHIRLSKEEQSKAQIEGWILGLQ